MDPKEIVNGMKRTLGLVLSRDEVYVFVNYLDADNSGGISYKEFSDKVNFKDYQKRSHRFLVSEKNFIDRILSIWYDHRAKEREKLHTFILSFDDNGDKIIQFDEFEVLMKHLEPAISKPKIIEFYNKCLQTQDENNFVISLNTLNDVIMLYKLGGYGKEFFGPYLESVKSYYKEMKKSKK